MQRRHFIAAILTAPLYPQLAQAAAQPPVIVWKSPTCGCCGAWVDHMRQAGFRVESYDVSQDRLDAIKAGRGVPAAIESCHTAEIGGYVIEGHVPATDIRNLLAERPAARGLTVPGMVVGSPGMEMGGMADPFVTLLISRDGGTSVFARHNGA